MKKTKVIIALIVIALLIAALYLSMDKIENALNIGYPALKLTISTGVNESDDTPIITNMTFEQTRVIYKGTDSVVDYPDISVIARNDTISSAPVSYWGADPWIEGSNETHSLTLTFRDSYSPKKGDLLILTVRFTEMDGFVLGKHTAFYEWK